ncbi:SdrD B-like domain-containing protein [Stieleria varia]|uniref:Serine-aspartate repeat-containing protein D n=1 Tax=Stieleria varia TaxID=2528005 RepID=A0A5C6AU40_9BACT|nr:SdrD B-like domain-containing protein [Stieleria varia]TWU02566.1 Serine-aspartate repeat-containing protein D precursor [Stieleria varia]
MKSWLPNRSLSRSKTRRPSSRAKRQRLTRTLRLQRFESRMMLAGDVVFMEDFESGDGGFTVDNTGGSILGQWHHSIGRSRDGLPGHSPTHAFYYGQFETVLGGGRYPVFTDHQGTLTSPEIELGCGVNTLSFSYLLDTRDPLDQDFAEVRIIDVSSGTKTLIMSRAGGEIIEGDYRWHQATADISQWEGKTIQVEFLFDTGDAEPIDPEGWYIDDILVTNEPHDGFVDGVVFEDINGNGVRDTAEPGLSGWEIRAYRDANGDGKLDQSEFDAGPAVSDFTSNGLTDKDADGNPDAVGFYRIDVPAGEYIVVEGLLNGWQQSLPGQVVLDNVVSGSTAVGELGYAVVIECDQATQGFDFGNFETIDVSGRKFEDADANGLFDLNAGDSALPGWQIHAYQDNGTTVGALDPGDTLVTTVTTDSNGEYRFDLVPGDYLIVEEQRSGWRQSTPTTDVGGNTVGHASDGFSLAVRSGDSLTDVDFGNYVTGSIHVFKFNDLNADGVHTSNEPGWAGITISLMGVDGLGNTLPTITATTDASGNVDFTDLIPGVYSVTEILPSMNLASTPVNVTGIVVSSRQEWVAVANQAALPADSLKRESILDADLDGVSDLAFGNYLRGSIHGQKFNDINANGIKDIDEPGVNGVSFSLSGIDSQGNAILPVRTTVSMDMDLDGDGSIDPLTERGLFWFADLDPGTYTVTETVPNNSVATTGSSVGGIVLTSGVEFVAAAGQAMLAANSAKQEQVLDRDNDGVADLAFGNALKSSIVGHKFEDLDGDGIEDLGEPRLNGFVVELLVETNGVFVIATDSNGNARRTVTADRDLNGDSTIDPVTERGLYWFDGLSEGIYRVREVLTATQVDRSWRQSTASAGDISLPLGAAVVAISGQSIGGQQETVLADLAIGNYVLGSLHGQVYNDINGNGVQDPGETGLDGVTITLSGIDGKGVAIGSRSFVTTSMDLNGDGSIDSLTERGLYGFTDLAPGTYTLTEVVPAGSSLTTPNPVVDVSVSSRMEWVSGVGQAMLGSGAAKVEMVLDRDTDGVPDLNFGNAGNLDFGDAPSPSFPTLLASDGARHAIVPGFHLGALIDAEPDGQPTAAADGDDNAGVDDEDGVVFANQILAGFTSEVTVTLANDDPDNRDALLNAWIDFNGDGAWDSGEQIFTDLALTAGAQTLTFNVPLSATLNEPLVTRFRLSSTGGLPSDGSGFAIDGEVEDHTVTIRGFDFGDALRIDGGTPTYPTLLADDGARHIIQPGFYLGSDTEPDAESDGQPTVLSNGDDADGTDDEDGVVLRTAAVQGQSNEIDVLVPSTFGQGFLDAWIDYNLDGDWDDPGEQIFSSQSLSYDGSTGLNILSFTTPLLADVLQDFVAPARFRVSRAGGLSPGGLAMDGEVEDHLITITAQDPAFDGGDAPTAAQSGFAKSYPTLISNDGAFHQILEGLHLGNAVDDDGFTGLPTSMADGDDVSEADDEDGVVIPELTVDIGNVAVVSVPQTTLDLGGRLDAWIDLNRDGDWDDAGERLTPAGGQLLTTLTTEINLPAVATAGNRYARFRLSLTGGLSPGGSLINIDPVTSEGDNIPGEVEDYLVRVVSSPSEAPITKRRFIVSSLENDSTPATTSATTQASSTVPMTSRSGTVVAAATTNANVTPDSHDAVFAELGQPTVSSRRLMLTSSR